MDFGLNEEEALVQSSVRSFAQEELLPAAAAIDDAGVFPWPQVRRIAELGLMGMAVSPDWGGSGASPLAYAIAIEELSAGCASCGVITSVNNSLVGYPISTYGSQAQKERWLPKLAQGEIMGCYALSEPGTGSDAANQTCMAVADGDGYILNGEKNFITNGAEASVCVLFAMGDRSKGVRGIHAFVVPTDTPGFVIAKNERKMGIKGSSTSQISLQDVRVGPEALLGKPYGGFKIAMSTLDGGRIGIAAKAVGIARAAFEAARAYACERKTFGKPIAEHQAIQFMLADMATEIDAARLLVWRAAEKKGRGEKYSTQSAMAKLYAAEMSARVTHKALQIFGGYGYTKDFPAERHVRDARICEIYEGTSEIQRIVIARSLLAEVS